MLGVQCRRWWIDGGVGSVRSRGSTVNEEESSAAEVASEVVLRGGRVGRASLTSPGRGHDTLQDQGGRHGDAAGSILGGAARRDGGQSLAVMTPWFSMIHCTHDGEGGEEVIRRR
jgi:hypothetical protein